MASKRTLQSAAVLALLALASCASALADTYPRQPGIRILKYSFEVTLGDASDELTVGETVDLEFARDGVRALDLDLCSLVSEARQPDALNPCLVPAPRAPRGSSAPTPTPPSSVGKGMTVTSVLAGGDRLEFQHRNDKLHVVFGQPSHAGGKITLTIGYHGVPATGLFIGKNKFGDRVFFTDNWPNKARNWLATVDHISVKAPKTISVIAPRHYQVISNGLLREQTDLPGELRKTTWEESMPIPSWQYSLGVAQFSVSYFGERDDAQFSAWMFPQDREAGLNAARALTAPVFDFYRENIAPYSYEKLAHVEAAGSGGATEPATTIFYFGGFGALSHEMAHQWFGNAVTESDWDDVWLSEGFATYFALLFTEHRDGRDAFLAGVRRTRDIAIRYALAHPDDTVVHNNLQVDSNVFFNAPQIYQGGAMVLHMLRGVVGDENFWAGIRLYSSRFRNASASTDDFRQAMQDACHDAGHCPKENEDLAWFFHEWLNRGGVLQVSGNWHYDAEAKQLRIELDQRQPQGLFRMPIEIGITTAAPASGATARPDRGPALRIEKVVVDKQHNEILIPLDAAPADVQLDPNLWLPMMQATFAKQ